MKKALDQTVRSVKREVNKKVLKVPEIERKVLEATCNEPWGPHGTLMADIAQASRNFNDYQMTMTILWKRLNDSGRNWRHVYKSLTVMEFLVAHGAERLIDDLREHTYQIQTLVDFQYIDSHGRDQGLNVRKKAQALVALINDKEKIREVRQKAASNRDKYRGSSIYRASSYSSTGGTYEEDDRYRRDDRSRDGDRYRDDDRYEDRYSRDGDRYRDDDRSGGDRNRYGDNRADGAESRYGYDDARSSGSKDEDDWRRTPKARPNPPSYEEAASPPLAQEKSDDTAESLKPSAQNGTAAGLETQRSLEVKPEADGFEDFDPRASAAPGIASVATAPPSFMSAVEELFADNSASDTNFQPSNPFGSSDFRAASTETGGFGNSPFQAEAPTNGHPTGTDPQPPAFEDALALAIVPQSQYATEAPQQQSETTQQPPPLQHTQSFPGEQAFQSFPPAPQAFPQAPPAQQAPPSFSQATQQAPQSFPQAPAQATQPFPQPANAFQSFPPAQAFPPQAAFAAQPPAFAPQQQQQFPPAFASQQQQQRPQFQQQFPQQFPSFAQPFTAQQQQQQPFTSQQQFNQQIPQNQQQQIPQQQQQQQIPQHQHQHQHQQIPQNQPQQQIPQQQTVTTKAKQQEKFQPKSAVWADTLNLVDLNIGPLKNDPLAELGIQIKESRVAVSQQRKEEKVPSTMGRAMGSGSGLGIAAASVMPPAMPPPPPIMNGGTMTMGGGTMVPTMVAPHMMMMPQPPRGMMPGMGIMGPPMPMMNPYHHQQPQYGGGGYR